MQKIGMTVECPDNIKVPSGALATDTSIKYWTLSANKVYHNGRKKILEFNINKLRVGDTIGCSINKDGELHYYVNGKDRGVGWDDKLSIKQKVYGFVDIGGRVTKISSLFYCGKCKCMET